MPAPADRAAPARAALALAAALLAVMLAPARAEPLGIGDACFVRPEPRPQATAPSVVVVPAATESRLGIRRKTGQLFDVEIAVVGADGALCAVSGVARLRAGETLVLPVRPDAGKGARPVPTPCLVSLRSAAGGVEVATTEAACQAQALCAGAVQLHGQRFDSATRVPAGGRGPCFGGAP
jgi:hypothetical protein